MSPREWLLLVVLSFLWGSAFFFNELVIADVPPFTAVLGRMSLAAVVLHVVLRLTGHTMPRDLRLWRRFLFMGAVNSLIPFSLIMWGQYQVTGGLASILVASSTLFTVVLAHILTRDEKLTAGSLIGTLVALAGITFIVGIGALRGLGAEVLAQGACLLGALCYAVGNIFGRRLRDVPAVVSATGQVTSAAVLAVPVALLVDRPWTLPAPGPQALGGLVALALLSTTAAYIIYFRVLSSAGATNIVLVSFLIPISALVLGATFLGESVDTRHLAGIALVAFGLAAIDGRPLRFLRSRTLRPRESSHSSPREPEPPLRRAAPPSRSRTRP